LGFEEFLSTFIPFWMTVFKKHPITLCIYDCSSLKVFLKALSFVLLHMNTLKCLSIFSNTWNKKTQREWSDSPEVMKQVNVRAENGTLISKSSCPEDELFL
jgi:hypothetical protein